MRCPNNYLYVGCPGWANIIVGEMRSNATNHSLYSCCLLWASADGILFTRLLTQPGFRKALTYSLKIGWFFRLLVRIIDRPSASIGICKTAGGLRRRRSRQIHTPSASRLSVYGRLQARVLPARL